MDCVKQKKWWDAIRALLGQRRKDRQVKEKVQVAITVVFNLQIRISAPPPFQKLMQPSWGLQGFSGDRGVLEPPLSHRWIRPCFVVRVC